MLVEHLINKQILLNSSLILFLAQFFHIASLPIMEQEPKNVTVLDGKDATIVCRAVGAPTPNITWTYNSKANNIFCYEI